MIMKKQFIRSRSPFVYNLIFNKRRSDENEIIHWYLLIKLGNDNEKAIYLYLFIFNIQQKEIVEKGHYMLVFVN